MRLAPLFLQFGVSPRNLAQVYVAAMVSLGLTAPSRGGGGQGSGVRFNPLVPSLVALTFPQFLEALLRCASLSVVKVRAARELSMCGRHCCLGA